MKNKILGKIIFWSLNNFNLKKKSKKSNYIIVKLPSELQTRTILFKNIKYLNLANKGFKIIIKVPTELHRPRHLSNFNQTFNELEWVKLKMPNELQN